MLTITDMGTGMFAKTQFESEYGQEVLGGEWNHALPIMQAVVAELAEQLIERNTIPRDLQEADIEAFLCKMYAAQQ